MADQDRVYGLTVDALVLNDDARGPYRLLLDAAGTAQDLAGQYTDLLFDGTGGQPDQVWGIIVPLPEKVYLSAHVVDSMTLKLINDPSFLSTVEAAAEDGNAAAQSFLKALRDKGGSGRLLLRPVLSTSSQFKMRLQALREAEQPEMIPQLRQAYESMTMPHYVWSVQITTPDLWYTENRKRVLGEVVLDATAHPAHHLHFGTGFIAMHLPGVLFARDATAYSEDGKEPTGLMLSDDGNAYRSNIEV